MRVKHLAWVALLSVVPVASFWAASQQSTTPALVIPSDGRPANLEPVAGTSLNRVVLSARAAERLGIETVAVGRAEETRASVTGTRHVIPYSAVLYDARGETWVYTNPQPLVFVRNRVGIDYIEGDRAVLVDGPPAGTVIVAVGGAELFGTEFEVGHRLHTEVQP